MNSYRLPLWIALAGVLLLPGAFTFGQEKGPEAIEPDKSLGICVVSLEKESYKMRLNKASLAHRSYPNTNANVERLKIVMDDYFVEATAICNRLMRADNSVTIPKKQDINLDQCDINNFMRHLYSDATKMEKVRSSMISDFEKKFTKKVGTISESLRFSYGFVNNPAVKAEGPGLLQVFADLKAVLAEDLKESDRKARKYMEEAFNYGERLRSCKSLPDKKNI